MMYYNGIELPDLLEWDEVTYPCAVIIQCLCDDAKNLYGSEYVFAYGTRTDWPGRCTLLGMGAMYNAVGEEWVLKHTPSTWGTTVIDIWYEGWFNPVWTNTDIPTADGTGILLAASEPTTGSSGTITSNSSMKEFVMGFLCGLVDKNTFGISKLTYGRWFEDALDTEAKNFDPDIDTEDKFILMDNKGNVTAGYMYKEDEEAETFGEEMQAEYNQTPIDLTARVRVSREVMEEAGWDIGDGDYATVNTVSAYASEFDLFDENGNDYAINLTPILPDGTVINGGEIGLKDWIREQLASGKDIKELYVFLGSYETMDEAVAAAIRLHELQQDYYAMLGFVITDYNSESTDFKAMGWLRVSRHANGSLAGQITIDDFRTEISEGYNYIGNIRYCTREKLYYNGTEIWPAK